MNTHVNDPNILGVKVADHISAMIAYWDKDLVCRFANAAYLQWFGKRREDMVNKMTLDELLGPLFERNLPYIKGALNGEIQTFEREIPIPSGGVRQALANYYPEIIEEEVVGFFVHVADVTPLKLLETELVESNLRIQEQNKRLLNFSNIVSHNLKSYAANLSTILEMYGEAESEEEKTKLFGFLNRISAGFTSTVNHLNEISKTQHLAKIHPERIHLRTYIEKANETLLIQIQSTNTILTNSVGTDVYVMANPAYLDSILLNLMSNAIKYRKPNVHPVIEISCSHKDDTVWLRIADNGRGINLQKHGAGLFGMYKTFHGNSDAEGVGLFITKFQVETMGGQIQVESTENIGSTFLVSFTAG